MEKAAYVSVFLHDNNDIHHVKKFRHYVFRMSTVIISIQYKQTIFNLTTGERDVYVNVEIILDSASN